MIRVPVPDFLVDTPVGGELVRRIVSNDFKLWPSSDIDGEWLKPVPLSGLIKVERRLGRGLSAEDRICVGCGEPTRSKCSTCLRAHYCSSLCQRTDWRRHREICRIAEPIVSQKLAVAMPDYQCFWTYQDWLAKQCTNEERLGTVILSREYFIDMFGEDHAKRTCVTLALSGRPQCLIVRVFH